MQIHTQNQSFFSSMSSFMLSFLALGAATLPEPFLAFLFAEAAFGFLLSKFVLLETALPVGGLGVATTGGFWGTLVSAFLDTEVVGACSYIPKIRSSLTVKVSEVSTD